MTPLPAPETLSPAAYKAFLAFAGVLRGSKIEPSLHDLVNIRASQINGWNRVSIGFATVPGSKDAAYGIANSGLN
jgi:alkylhydroperoxidase family enzyme